MSKVQLFPSPAGWDVKVSGRWLDIGAEVSITGKPGRYKYQGYHITSEGKINLDFVGGKPGHEMFHSFYPERVEAVHSKRERRAR